MVEQLPLSLNLFLNNEMWNHLSEHPNQAGIIQVDYSQTKSF